jgi:hypothetical protein
MAPMKAMKTMKTKADENKAMKAMKTKAEKTRAQKAEDEEDGQMLVLIEAKYEEQKAWDAKQQATIDAGKMGKYEVEMDLAYRKAVGFTKDTWNALPKKVQRKWTKLNPK